MKYTKSSGTSGPWLDKSKVYNGQKFAILTEARPIEEIYKGEPNTRNTVKVKVQGLAEPQNYDLNKPTIAGLIDAFGDDSSQWIGKVLQAHTEKVRVAGKAGIMVILYAEGFKVMDDEGGYAVVVPANTPEPVAPAAPEVVDQFAVTVPAPAAAQVAQAPMTSAGIPYPTEEIRPEDIPF